jgi:spore coat polysaccharide biosynthesis protein SpsF
MKTVGIIQAHMGSSRLPGKVLKDLAGKPMLERVVRRVQRFSKMDEVVVAASNLVVDDPIEEKCLAWSVPVFRGDDEDVLSRFLGAAHAFGADTCVRITSDCPLIDPEVGDDVIDRFLAAAPAVDYASNKIPQSYPRGLDTEVFTLEALERADRQARHNYERTHVTIHMYEHPEQFKLLSVVDSVDRSAWRWTVDTDEDLEFVRQVYARLGGDGLFGWKAILELLEAHPELRAINSHVRQKAVQEG